jgi:hypothetical protein
MQKALTNTNVAEAVIVIDQDGEFLTNEAGVSASSAQAVQGVDGGVPVPVTASNITTKFREAFESYTPGQRWTEVKGSGDLIYVDGNAAAASYLVVSKNPLAAGVESSVETIPIFTLPLDVSVGLSLSQRTLGQEFAVELVDTQTPLPDVADIAISAISQTTTILTVDTATAHGLSVGKSIGIRDCSNQVANYPALVVATTPSPTQFTATAGPGGTIASQTITNPAGAKGFVFFRERLGRAQNGLSQIFENATATNASLYIRSEAGDALPSGVVAGNHAVTVGTTAPVALVSAANQYAWSPTTEFRFFAQADRTQWADGAVDAVAATTSRLLRTQVCPDPSVSYKLRIRTNNSKALTIPNAQIVSAVKTGTTTATITTDVAHNYVTGDTVVIYGIRAQGATEFPNLTTATAVTVTGANTFTIVIGTAGTVTSYGGYVAKVQGGNLMSALGAAAQVIQSATLSTLSDGTRQLVLVGSAAWAAPANTIGDLVNIVGVRDNTTGASLGVDGAWKIANVATTNLTLVLPYAGSMVLPTDFGVTNCGGGVIKRTDMRVSFVRVFDYERERVELLPRPTGDIAAAVPVAIQNTPAVTVSSGTITTVTTVSTVTAITGGTTNEDAPTTVAPLIVGGVVRTAVAPTSLVAGDAARLTLTTGAAAVVAPYAIPEVTWQTPANVGGLVNTATPLQVKEAAGALLCNYVTAIDLFSEALTNATDLRIREPDLTCSSQTIASNTLTVSTTHNLRIGDAVVFTASTVTGISAGVTYYVLTTPAATTITLSATRGGSTLVISGTGVTATFHKVLWMTRIPTTGVTPRALQFLVPLRGSVNTALQLQTATASGAGAVYASLQGFAAQ